MTIAISSFEIMVTNKYIFFLLFTNKYLPFFFFFPFFFKKCFKASVEKVRWLYEFPFSLNPGDKPNVADITELIIIISTKYRRPVPSKFKEKLMEHLRGSKTKPTKYLLDSC